MDNEGAIVAKLPIDTSARTLLCAQLPQPVMDFETKRPKADENGELLYSVQLVALADGGAEILPVKVAGQPSAQVTQGSVVKVVGLVATPWAMGDRSGISFKATRIDPAPVSTAKTA